MASIRKEFHLGLSPDSVWAKFRDVAAVPALAPGFVTETEMEGDARIVTFANGFVAREVIIDVDEAARRLAYSVQGSPRLTHHSASFEVLADGRGGSLVVWRADLLPQEMAPTISSMMDQGVAAMAGGFGHLKKGAA